MKKIRLTDGAKKKNYDFFFLCENEPLREKSIE